MVSYSHKQVDHAEIKTGQVLTMAIASIALLTQDLWALAVLGIIFFLSGTVRSLSPFYWIYHWIVLPSGLVRSDYRMDIIQPHKFGQLVGAMTVVIALSLLNMGYTSAGWMVVLVLVILTATSYMGWCIGCFIYYQMNRLGIRGFFRHRPVDSSVFPGRRPPPATGPEEE